ncbi:hypothetical protein HK101_002764 [Irineochytrium annulatum]|nr:hypothetical protein HK101_002764 [Irineochytrium annulatum]
MLWDDHAGAQTIQHYLSFLPIPAYIVELPALRTETDASSDPPRLASAVWMNASFADVCDMRPGAAARDLLDPVTLRRRTRWTAGTGLRLNADMSSRDRYEAWLGSCPRGAREVFAVDAGCWVECVAVPIVLDPGDTVRLAVQVRILDGDSHAIVGGCGIVAAASSTEDGTVWKRWGPARVSDESETLASEDRLLYGSSPKTVMGSPMKSILNSLVGPPELMLTGLMGKLVAEYDWSKIPEIGPIESWPMTLRAAVNLTINSPDPAVLYWGSQNWIIAYNDVHIPIAKMHPAEVVQEIGMRYLEAYPAFKVDLVKKAKEKGVAALLINQSAYILTHDSGHEEEVFFTFCRMPLPDDVGNFTGALYISSEGTADVSKMRRMNIMTDFTKYVSASQTIDDAWQRAADAVTATNIRKDVPTALIYRHSYASDRIDAVPSRAEDLSPTQVAWLKAAPSSVDLITDDVEFSSSPTTTQPEVTQLIIGLLRRAWESGTRQEMTLEEKSFRTLVVLPLGSSHNNSQGLLVLETNPLLPYNEAYKNFFEMIVHQISMAIVNISSLIEAKTKADALTELDKVKTAFFTSMSHELRTPLTLILGPLEDSLDEACIPLKIRRNLRLAHGNAVRVLKVINDLLEFSRVQSGRMVATFRPTDVAEKTRFIASLFGSAAERSGLEYVVDVDSNVTEPAYIDCVIIAIRLGNAIKFTVKGKIVCRLYANASTLYFSVEDTGVGIAEEDLGNLFQTFQRFQSSRGGRAVAGSGIGLALTKELVKLHGGNISVTSSVGVGTTITVSIPLGCSHLPPDRIVKAVPGSPPDNVDDELKRRVRQYWTANEASQSISSVDVNSPMEESAAYLEHSNLEVDDADATAAAKKYTVFVVDDNGDMRNYVSSLLMSYNTREFVNGETALKAASEEAPDLIICDVMMPVMDGLSMVRNLRKNQKTSWIPVILLTGRTGEQALVSALGAGADDCMVKPFGGKELLARVKTQLELGRIRHQLEAEKDRTEKKHMQLAAISPVCFFWADEHRIITVWNRLLEDFFEVKPEMVTRFKEDAAWRRSFIHEEDREKYTKRYEDAFVARTNFVAEYRINPPSGNIRWIKHEAIVDTDARGNFKGHLHCLTNITEAKRMENERLEAARREEAAQRRRADEAEESRKQQESFIDMICHEIRNPLNGIMNSNYFIAESLADIKKAITAGEQGPVEELNKLLDSAQDAAEAISQCSKHQKVIVDDVLTSSKLNMDLLVISTTTEFDPQQLLTTLHQTFKSDLDAKRITTSISVSANFERLRGSTFTGDPSRLSQILINLLINAIKFTQNVEIREIESSLDAFIIRPGSCRLCYAIKDSGIGMTEEEKMSLFRRFSQASAKVVRIAQLPLNLSKTYAEYGGSGLGLFISKRLIEMMNGTIHVVSEKGKGCVFSFDVEVACSPPALINSPTAQLTLDTSRLNGIVRELSKGFRCLVVDDNEINRKVLTRHLKALGHQCEMACNGQEAVDMIAADHSRFDKILMDMEMPIKDGCEATRAIRVLEGEKRLAELHIIAVTGNARQEKIKMAIDSGMQNVLLKPFTREQ